ncbi:kelch repeat-containing protein [uncultured Maricaulis sp.]|uniref:Kelch repeat-containing protein n=1 Tax=uncultured Maricaulis sp. TaxID=174710 RepID=UPI0030D7241F|tara:strand:+ start:38050 stop:39003 length:954 start_codon:yes stop_codon:yes gene_type:complete
MVHLIKLMSLVVLLWTPAAAAQGHWESAARLDVARAGLAVTVLDGRLYAAGGAGLTAPRAEFEVFDPEIDRWMPETSLPRGLERFGMAAINGRIYAAGGYAAGELGVEPTALMWSWSTEGRIWQSEIAMPGPKADFAMLAVDDRLYAIGGTRDDNSIYVFDPEGLSWETLEIPDDVTRRGSAVVGLDGRIYVIGGSLRGELSAQVDIYDLATNAWSRGPDLPGASTGIAAVVHNSRIHVLGGTGVEGEQRLTLRRHASWQPGETAWRSEADLPTPRTAADAAVLNGSIYLIGGGSGGGFFAPFTAMDATDVFFDEAS